MWRKSAQELKSRATYRLTIACFSGALLLLIATSNGWIQFDNQFHFGDLLSLIGLIGVGIGLYFSYLQIQMTARQLRGSFVAESSTRILDDPDLSDLFYRIDHDIFTYNSGFANSADEKAIDRLLFHFEQLAALVELQAIEISDLKVLEYPYLRVFKNPHVRKYLEYLDGLSSKVEVEASFPRFRRIAARMIELQRKESPPIN
jgi:hypothetical protein